MSEQRSAPKARSGLLFTAILGACTLAALEPSCLERRDDGPRDPLENRCTACHGEARPGDFVLRSAPPRDLLGATDPSYPGVGGHAIHLYASETHSAFACSECHVVPERVDSPGHADDARPAELVFGALASTGERKPSYDPVARTCADTHCHGNSDAVWTSPRKTDEACGSCHGLPPRAPHPQSSRCFVCHANVIDEQRRFIAPALHVNGITEYAPGDCALCHGGVDSPAPPFDTLGNRDETALGVGAHRVHLQGGAFSRALECGECHSVPKDPDIDAHVGKLPAEVRLTGVAETQGREPYWDHREASCTETWCHGPESKRQAASPRWTVPEQLGCASCHGMPPPAPHPHADECSSCHGAVAGAGFTIVNRAQHVDGIVDTRVDQDCTFCHGGDTPAPPRDLGGNTATDSPGVGAHDVHLAGTARSRKVACGECHHVPDEVLAPGHIDTDKPAEVTFAGAATAFGGMATYANGRCENTSCHGAVFPDQHASGATNSAPLWTRVNGTEAACGKCHGLPPPAPHPRGDLNPICGACHENIEPDNLTFNRPDLHVDGVVTFAVP